MMNWADWTIVAIIGVSCLISILRGFMREALSLAAWVAAVLVATTFHTRLASQLARWIETPSMQLLLAFAALFIGTLVVGSIVNHIVGALVRAGGLGGLDRLLGITFGLARGALIVLALVMLLPMALPVKADAWWQESALIPHFESLENWARDTFMPLLDRGRALLPAVPTPGGVAL
jgi:membrane protein required for colicin V production